MAKSINGNDVVSGLEEKAAEIKTAKKEVIKLANGWVVYPITGATNQINGIPSGVGVVMETDKGTVFVPNSKVVRVQNSNGTFIRWEVMSCYKASNGSRPELQEDVIIE